MACDHCEELEEKVRQLEAALHGNDWEPPADFHLTWTERILLQTLVARNRVVPVWLLYEATRYSPRARGDDVDPKIVSVRMSTLRSKLRPFGIEIETFYSDGYRINPDSRQRLLSWSQREAA